MELIFGFIFGVATVSMLVVSGLRKTNQTVNVLADNLDGAHRRLLASERERIKAQRKANTLSHQLRGE